MKLWVYSGSVDQATRARPCDLLVNAYAVVRLVLWKVIRSLISTAQDVGTYCCDG